MLYRDGESVGTQTGTNEQSERGVENRAMLDNIYCSKGICNEQENANYALSACTLNNKLKLCFMREINEKATRATFFFQLPLARVPLFIQCNKD